MSVMINGNNITITQGDTLICDVAITDAEGNTYVPVSTDKIRFALKERYSDEIPLIFKRIPYDTLELRLESEDTKKLQYGTHYYYDIQITYSDGIVCTFIKGTITAENEVI